jgi:monoamine oxidase
MPPSNGRQGERAFVHPVSRPPLRRPEGNVDVAIVGAGAAGIAAARRCLARGLTVAVLEARDRVGGRAVTVPLKGHPVDLGAHWLHAGPINPLVRLGYERGEPLRRAPVEGHLVLDGRLAKGAERAGLDRGFGLADRALTLAARAPEDRAAATALPLLGRWRERIATVHGLVSGRPLGEVSLHDFPSMEYADNRFISGGFGAYVARLAAGLPIALETAVRAIDWSGPGVRIETAAGSVRARAAIVTVPVMVLQTGAVRFTPALPEATDSAVAGFLSGTYEHVVLHWPGSPLSGADRLATILGRRLNPPGLLARIDATAFHYLELDHPTAEALADRGADAARRFARAVLAEHFGSRALHGVTIPAVTSWKRDPHALGSWVVAPPGHALAREHLREPVGDRLWFAGEALSRVQWGTVGGAWEEGERAADAAADVLTRGA